MIQIIYGEKGTGKTKQIVDAANDALMTAKGDLVFIEKGNALIHELEHKIRLINAEEYDIGNEVAFAAFVTGVLAANHDTQIVYIDGIARITGLVVEQMANLFNVFDKLTANTGVDFVVTLSCSEGQLPSFVNKYVKNQVR